MPADAAAGLDWTFRAMGADWRLHHSGGVDGTTAQAVAEAVAADEALWSRFLPGSDVTRVNRAAGRAVAVAPATFDLIAAAVAWTERTGGLFQPLQGAQLVRWGYRGGVGDGAPACAPPAARVPAGPIELNAALRTVRIPSGTALDLGGIGKSAAAVRAGALLAERSDDPRLIVDAGGDLAIIRGDHRVATAAGAVLARAGTGVATSSSERRAWVLGDGTPAHHLIDPRTGAPGARGTAVVCDVDPVAADVLASCAVLEPALVATLDAAVARIDVAGATLRSPRWAAVAAPGLSGSSHGGTAD